MGDRDLLEVDPPLHRAHVDRRPATTFVRWNDPAKVGQRLSGSAAGQDDPMSSDSVRMSEYSPLRPARFPAAPGYCAELLEIGRTGWVLTRGRPAQELLGGDPRQVDGRIGMHQDEGIIGRSGTTAVSRQRLAEAPVLEGQVAQQLERVVAPDCRTPRRPPAGATSDRAGWPPGETNARPRHRPACDRFSRLRGQARDRPVTVPAIVDIEDEVAGVVDSGLIRRQLGDLVAELLDHLLINLDRFRPLLAAT